jgi:hypothetical protein
MGWWAFTIMGGDTPCDYYYDYEVIAKINTDDEDRCSNAVIKAAINKHIKKLYAHAKKLVKQDGDGIAAQVLGVFIATHGAKMTKEIKEFILKGIDNDINDEWENADERKAHLNRFRRQIKCYPLKGMARGITVHNEGLLESLFQRLN